ncbi:hypothetical protein RZN25_16820 [Bacillaceae bacterium S4-13-56]
MQRLRTGWSPVIEAASPYEENMDVELENEKDESKNQTTPPLEEKEENKEEPVIIEFNTLPIDFDQLIANETNEDLKMMHEYFKSVTPTPKNEFTGVYEGYNLILITAEGFSSYAVNKEVTPTLYKLANEGYKFTNFYNPLWEVSASDG